MRRAIPTIFEGVQYRSRLEARWAAFFTLLGWPFEYEPYDLDGWIPDFLLMGKVPVLVEVKPIVKFDENASGKINRCYPIQYDPEYHSDYRLPDENQTDVLLVGASLVDLVDDGILGIGWLRDGNEFADWSIAPFGRWIGSESKSQNPNYLYGFCSLENSFQDRITGCYDGGRYGRGLFDREEIRQLWKKSGNLVQWRGQQSTTNHSANPELVPAEHSHPDPFTEFLAQCCDIRPDRRVIRQALYTCWRDWCRTRQVFPFEDSASFGRRLKAALPAVGMTQPWISGKKRRFYTGISLKSALVVGSANQ